MQRVGARPHYRFSAETLERWALDPNSLVLGAAIGESLESVTVFCVAGNHAEAHINGCTERGRELGAWLFWNGARRLSENGVDVLNIGGGIRPGDGVQGFKERFHATPRPLQGVRQIYDPATYLELCRRAGAPPQGSWFPAYRAEAAPATSG